VLIDAVINDEIQTVYDAEAGLFELEKPMNKEEFMKRLLKSDADDQVAELQPLYEIDFPYNTGEIVESDGINYTSIQDNNLENDPASSPDWWEVWAGEESEPYLASEITIIEVMEDVIFRRVGREITLADPVLAGSVGPRYSHREPLAVEMLAVVAMGHGAAAPAL